MQEISAKFEVKEYIYLLNIYNVTQSIFGLEGACSLCNLEVPSSNQGEGQVSLLFLMSVETNRWRCLSFILWTKFSLDTVLKMDINPKVNDPQKVI